MDHSPGIPPSSTAWSSTSFATGHVDPTSSRRRRLSAQPVGRGFERSSSRMASISLWAMGLPRSAGPDLLHQPPCPVHLFQPFEDRLPVEGHRTVGPTLVPVVASERPSVPVEDERNHLAV